MPTEEKGAMMIFEQIDVGGDRNFAYLVGDEQTRHAAIIDPGDGPELVVRRAGLLGVEIRFVLNTHGHHDHTGGNSAVQRLTGARLAAFAGGDLPLKDGDVLRLGELDIKTLHTPGHTTDSVCFLAGENLATGDTLFVGKIGGTHDRESAVLEYRALHEKICTLPPETRVWPGHNYGTHPSSTVGEELRTNPFLLCPDFESFLDLKDNWAEYKRIHGIG
jgi:glyoxylase-like metal-dependent hydrolase (beta-lactamase superfamily II)